MTGCGPHLLIDGRGSLLTLTIKVNIMNEIREQIVITRARASYLSEQPDQVDTNMHKANADTMEKLLAALEAIYKDGVWNECEYCARKAVLANDAIDVVQTKKGDERIKDR